MKNLFALLLLFGLSFGMTSCGDDDGCTQSDFVGTYNLTSDAICELDENATVTAEEVFVISAGANDDQVVIEGETLTIVECTANSPELFPVTLDGDVLTVDIFGCEFKYKKQ